MEAEIETIETKRRLRRELRATRRALSAATQHRAANAVATRGATASPLVGARSIVGYIATDGELDVATLLDQRRRAGAAVFLPRVRDDGALDLVAVRPGARLVASGPGGVLEPVGPATPLDRIPTPAVVLTPSVALDRRGNRLGRGGGAYDRLLAALPRPAWRALGVCHAHSVIARVPIETHDRPVDAVLTERGVIELDRQDARPTGP